MVRWENASEANTLPMSISPAPIKSQGTFQLNNYNGVKGCQFTSFLQSLIFLLQLDLKANWLTLTHLKNTNCDELSYPARCNDN